MAKATIWFGAALMVLGIAFFLGTGSVHHTALIPTWFGLALVLCGWLSLAAPAQRMAWMHIAVTVGLIGFVFPAVRAGLALAHGAAGAIGHAPAVDEELAMAIICLIFTVLCVRSFIAARVARKSETIAVE